jgi:lysophospholipase L1-like esterase
LKEDVINLKPDILSLMIGVNDVYFEQYNQSGANAAKFAKVLKLILEETRVQLPNICFVLCEPFIVRLGGVAENWEFWSEEIKKQQEVVKKTAELYECAFVGLQQVFDKACEGMDPAYWIWDGIHPTAAGHELIARAWSKAVEINAN